MVPGANGGRYRAGMRLVAWLFTATLSVILMLQLRGLDAPLHTPATPWGIVGFELSFTAARAQAMIDAWRAVDAIETARVGLGVDMGFLLAYPWFFRLSIGLLRRPSTAEAMDRLGAGLARAILACIPLDAIENLALWQQVSHEASPGLAALAGVMATLKFVLVLLAAAWCLAELGQRLRARLRPAQ